MTSQIERQENLLSDCINSLKAWKELIDTHLDGDEKAAEATELEEIVKEYCLIDFTASKTSEACQEVMDYFGEDSADPNVDVDDLYNERLAQKQENFSSNYQQHKIWKEVFLGVTDYDVEEVQQRRSTEPTEYEEMNDSIFCSNVFTPPVDPISKKVIEDPYKNRKCGHVYEYKFILQYIKSMKNKAKCPYIGCSNKNISVHELVPDKETQDKINKYMSQHVQNASQTSVEDSDNE